MKTIHYRCGAGHTFTDEAESGRGESGLPCSSDGCSSWARRFMVTTGKKPLDLVDVRCHDCGARSDYIERFDGINPPCPECKSTSITVIVSATIPLSTQDSRFPYIDRGLGMKVYSEADRKAKADALGLARLDDDAHFSAMEQRRREQAEDDELVAIADDYEERVANAPDFARYREAADRGALEPEDKAFVDRCREEHGGRASEVA